jgi:DNA-binding winged helix-turn-helix (wHTH) protein
MPARLADTAPVEYRFDNFTLDTSTRRLLRDTAEAHLSPKAFDLLRLLVANSSRAMSKSELHQHLWPSTHVLDTNLASLIAEIRQTLGDSADTPRYVRTVHRFGYWFVATVEQPMAPALVRSVRYWLIFDGRQTALAEGENILGRAPDAEIWIDVAGVSRHHARIRVDGPRATVEDLGSKNGTFLQGQPVREPAPLADGDQIRLGTVVITFRIPPPPESTDTAAPGQS